MAFSRARVFLLCALTATLLMAQDWQTGQDLPGVDFNGLTPVQRALALKILRSNGCPCGCGMRIAECRVKDPSCGYSKSLSATVAASARKGSGENAVLEALDANPMMHPKQPKLLEDAVPIAIEGDPFQGPKDAKVTIVEFSDFQCPYCSTAAAKLGEVVKAYPQVKLVFKQFPLESHPQAAMAAAAALAAHWQGKFWPMHDVMFANRTKLSRVNIQNWAGTAGLDMKRFEQDWVSAGVKQTIAREVKEGEKAGVEGTPSIYINGQKYNGQLDLPQIKPVLDAELKKK